MTLTVHFEPCPEPAALEPRWRALEAESAPSFFLGWTWIGSWLESSGARPELMSIRDGVREVALALVGRSRVRRTFGRVATLHWNEAGERDADRVFIEYNGLLCAPERAAEAGRAAIEALCARGDWRALMLSGLTPDSALVRNGNFRRRILRDVSPAYYVDLDAVRAADGDYLSLLSANSRSQIRRSFKDHGDADIEVASDAAQIDEWIEAMRILNIGHHADNAWDSASFGNFARNIARAGLKNGAVELLRIRCGGADIGYLLNFIWRGRAMNYQSAFAQPAGPKSKPGLMCHTAAVARYAGPGEGEGQRVYSFLAGKDRYKQSLSTHHEELEWWTLERFSPLLEAEAIARKLLRR